MTFTNTLRLILVIGFYCLSNNLQAQFSKTHYIPPLTASNDPVSAPQDQFLYISTPSTTPINVRIIPIGGAVINLTVSNTSPIQYFIANGNGTQLMVDSANTATKHNDKGFIIEAEDLVYVTVRMLASEPPISLNAQAGGIVSKGLAGLGTVFRVGAFVNQISDAPSIDMLTFVSVMATEDNTEVDFSDIDPLVTILNNTPKNVTLNSGESYVVAVRADARPQNRDGLVGALVSATKPIAVNCGSILGTNGNVVGGRDIGIDQIVPVERIGNEYIFVKAKGHNEIEKPLIVAHEDNTQVFLNGSGTPFTTLDAGEYVSIDGSNYGSNGNLYVNTSKNVFAYQGIGGAPNNPNQGMFFVPPLNCQTPRIVNNIPFINSVGSVTFDGGITIVTETDATVTINGIDAISLGAIKQPVTGNSNYETYYVEGLSGNVNITSTKQVYVAYFGANGFAAFGGYYSGFAFDPEIILESIDLSLTGNCIPNINLGLSSIANFDTYQWYLNDVAIPSATNINYTPTAPGYYYIEGQITGCPGTLISDNIPVSNCPDDGDLDDVNDNIDIDLDNDGILNCTESLGDQDINLSNSSGGNIPTGNYNYTGTITTKGNIAATPFLGIADGTFRTDLPSRTGNDETSVTFQLNFNKAISLSLEYASNTTLGNGLLTNDEEFIVQAPVDRTITVQNLDNQLLIDTNYDGIYETGVTEFSSFEIRFRVNAPSLTLGSGTFKFSSHMIDSFTIIHKNNSETNSNQATFKLTATCIPLDTDGDTVPDYLDLDSDNDGIPDFVENTGELLTFTNNDDDSDGLDDAYDPPMGPIDSDADGIPDYLDLDSDNDGIYDLIETGILGTLSDTNLDGIEDGPTYGINGWVDAAETAPDSNLIGYTPNDFDADTILSYIDLDSDGDGCSDVIEAGFSDGNADDLLGDNPVTVDTNGLVSNASDGYTLPNADYLDAAPITITTQPVNTTVCELAITTFSVVSAEAETYQWEISTDNGALWSALADDAIYSGTMTSDLTISNTPLSFNNYQYRVKLDRAGNTCGLYSDEIILTVDVLPVANTAPNMLLCDDDNNGTMPFNLTSQDMVINTISGMRVSYHNSEIDAENNAAPITSPYESGNTTIWARVENPANTSCYDISSFDLEVYESPLPLLNVDPLQECDDTSVGTDADGLKVFDLTQKETEILNGQSATDFTLTYFTDPSYLSTSEITTPTSFANTIAGGQTIYVRMTNNTYNTCVAETSFNIQVLELPVITNTVTLIQCDDDDPATLGFSPFNLNEANNEISVNAANENFSYYTSLPAAVSGDVTSPDYITNETSYTNAIVSSDTVWARVETQFGCSRVAQIQLLVSTTVIPSNFLVDFYACDDFLDTNGNDNTNNDNRDGIASFDLSGVTAQILSFIPPGQNLQTPRYFRNQADALAEENEITNITNYRNIGYPGTQEIYVRVDSDIVNDCLGLGHHITLHVEALPTANSVSFTRQCDIDVSDTVINYPFNTSNLESDVLGAQNPADVSINYFDSNGNPLFYADGITPVISPIQSTFLTSSQTIIARVTNNTTQDPDGPCYDEVAIEFIVDQQPVIADTVMPQIVCDGDAGDIDDDGYYSFDTSTFASTILGTQSNMDIFFDYIDESGTQVLNSTFLPDPLISSNQTISVQVINPLNPNCLAVTSIDLIVNPLPEFSIDSEHIVCTSDPSFTVELDPIEADNNESFTYQWRWTNLDGTITNQLLPETTRTIDVSQAGTYHVTLTKTDGTGCSRTRDIFVNASEKATITNDDVTIVDFTENNNSVSIDPTNLGQGDYEYALVEDGSSFIIYQDEPDFNNVKPGFYTIYVNDKNGCDVTTLDISVLGYMKFFTPNNDGYNDSWKIIGVNESFQPRSSIIIFDRYGKLLKQISTLENGWDGTSRGNRMPTDDYWFKVFLEDGRIFSGHFTLKR